VGVSLSSCLREKAQREGGGTDAGRVARDEDDLRPAFRRVREEVPVKTIMIATDGSEPAADALDVAIELARETGATLDVLSVRPPPLAGRAGAGPPIYEVEEPGGAERIAAAAAAHATTAGVQATAHSAHGDVVDAICEASDSLGADLVIVGSRGHGPVSGALLGSVSHGLIAHSGIPVTVVRQGASLASSPA
jgi:nucleotide-binding universal stress UspA family protein